MSSLPANAPGTCYKFIVATANEAASVIRDRLGENARVLSVRTIEPTGLRSLWGSPKIEVLATVPSVGADLGRSSSDDRSGQTRPLHLSSSDEASPVATAPTYIRPAPWTSRG